MMPATSQSCTLRKASTVRAHRPLFFARRLDECGERLADEVEGRETADKGAIQVLLYVRTGTGIGYS